MTPNKNHGKGRIQSKLAGGISSNVNVYVNTVSRSKSK